MLIKKLSLSCIFSILFVAGCLLVHIPSYNSTNLRDIRQNPQLSYPLPPYIQYVVSHEVIIDDTGSTWASITWEKAVQYYPWASGQGTEDNPYKIRYVFFYGHGVFSPLTIKNSDAYFTIQYCGFVNSSRTMPDEWWGLGLINVRHGTIKNIFCDENLFGICGSNCKDMLITDIKLFGNSWGMYFHGENNNVCYNSAYRNGNGFDIYGYNNTVEFNKAYRNNIGFHSSSRQFSRFNSNEAYDNSEYGFFFVLLI